MASKTGLSALQGPALVAAITSVCSSGFLLFGYDQGVMSGVVVSDFWLKAMGEPSSLMVGTITALYDVGAVVGAIAAAFTAEPLGRKRTLLLGATILIVGTVLMGSAAGRPQFMVARVVTGLGIGYITSVAPVYQSEISRATQRGWHICCQLSTMLFGLMLAYFINYGFYFHRGSVQWRFPLLFQLVFAVYIVLVGPFLPDTPRWLMRHEASPERGVLVLSKLRNHDPDHPEVRKETAEILEAIQIEAREEGSWADLFRSGGIQANKRFFLALGIQFMQQMSGINIVTYYAPSLFEESLNFSAEMSLLMGCFLQVWYLLASFVTWFTIDRVGRRPLLISMALAMCVVLVLEAVCIAIGGGAGATGPGIAAVVLVFLFEACFTWGWMACVWVYPPEILPLKIRAKGAALAAAADFLGNFLVVEVTPVALRTIGWRSYLIWAVLNLANAAIVWLFYPETAGVPLEQIDRLFLRGADAASATALDSYEEGSRPLYRKLQWSVVGRADAEIKRQRLLRNGQGEGGVRPEMVGGGASSSSDVVGESSSEKDRGSAELIEDKTAGL